ncbi:hypothetical protein [Deinococcus aquaedulcis]|uniref:hypothetical protein n=1 Tax=Deinococcus aquaedulcis TaxID=2840455 RepID=UPI001C8340FD|nr:hypothetical protein [Deinococcus aquaedulcis]
MTKTPDEHAQDEHEIEALDESGASSGAGAVSGAVSDDSAGPPDPDGDGDGRADAAVVNGAPPGDRSGP